METTKRVSIISNTLAILWVVSASASAPVAPADSLTQERIDTSSSIPDRYRFLYSSPLDIKAVRRALPFKSISIRHEGGLGPDQVYSATLNIDGSASYIGKESVDRIGAYFGSVYIRDFGQLSLYLERSGFMTLANRYALPQTDASTTTVTVTCQTGEIKFIEDYGQYAPPEVWLIERAIEGVVGRITWKSASGRP